MRKLKGAEVALLVTGLVIGNGNVDAGEEQTWGGTVVVTGTRYSINTLQMFQFSPGLINPGVIPAQSGTNSSAVSAAQRHAIDCAIAYAGGPKDGWITYFTSNYGWSRGFDIYAQTTTPTPPPGTGWIPTQGYTVGYHPGAPYIVGQSTIFLKSNATTREMISTIAHEWYHQWLNGYGHNPPNDEASAEAYGEQAADKYEADNGSKCGGL
jgi:hypothetical protein